MYQMPILTKKDNPPPKTFEESIIEKEGTWWIAKVRPRQEKSFAFDLFEQNVDYYLPYYEKKIKRSDGKIRKSYPILFPSYVPFISEQPHKIVDQKRILTILPIKIQSNFRIQLNFVYMSINYGQQILRMENSSKFALGDLVKVVNGPCKGISGRITNIKNDKYICFDVDSLGYIMICVGNSQIELLKPDSI